MSNKFEKLATKIGILVDSKNKQYGNSFAQSGEFLRLIYPDGISPSAYTDALCIVRIFDKLKRIGNAGNLPVNEGKIDAWSDIIGYGLLGLQKDKLEETEPALPDALEQPISTPLDQEVQALRTTETWTRLDALMRLEALKTNCGFEGLLKDVEEAGEPQQNQVRDALAKLDAERKAEKEALRQKEVSTEIFNEIEKARLAHDAAMEAVEDAPITSSPARCFICKEPFKEPIPETNMVPGTRAVHEECYRRVSAIPST